MSFYNAMAQVEEVLRERYSAGVRAAREYAEVDEARAERRGREYETDAVRAFHEAAGQPVRDVPTVPSDEEVRARLKMLFEEVIEAAESCLPDEHNSKCLISNAIGALRAIVDAPRIEVDLVNLARELTDIQYVTTGTQVQMGLPKEACFDEVQRANYDKVKDGVRLEGGKVQKPKGWQPPDIARVLREAGWTGGGE